MSNEAQSKNANAGLLLPESFSVTLKMKSDWHVGSGTGRPRSVDRLIRRDADGLPFIPAKTLTGIWRDACERVALGLDNAVQDGPWSRWVDHLFGEQPALATASKPSTPKPATLSIRPARLAAPLRRALRSTAAVGAAVTFVRPGVEIDDQTGRAKDKHLRFEEMARGNAVLTADCTLSLAGNEQQRVAAAALLVAGARFGDRLGGKRRRGSGRCQLIIDTRENISDWIDWIAKQSQPPSPPALTVDEAKLSKLSASQAAEDRWLIVPLALAILEPVVVPARTIGNVVMTQDFLPGAYLLRLIAKRLREEGLEAGEAIARGDLVVTNATVEVNGERGLPVPFSLFYEKGRRGLREGRDVFNRLHEITPEGKQPKGHRDGYISEPEEGKLPVLSDAHKQFETHNVVRDEFQRPAEAGVYSYQALKPGLRLRAEIKIKQTLAAKLQERDAEWFRKFDGVRRFGQAKKDDYGAIKLRADKPSPAVSHCTIHTDELIVWSLSDVLLRDERLRPSTSIFSLRDYLAERLSQSDEPRLKLALRESGPDTLPLVARQRRSDSWHVGWGLPRPSLSGLMAGTCVVFDVSEGKIDPKKVAEFEHSGIGERTAEGFGQVRFNPPLLMNATSARKPPADSKPPEQKDCWSIREGDNSFPYARLIEREAWRAEIRRAAVGLAADSKRRKKVLGIEIDDEKSRPAMSQLGALSSVLARLQSPRDKNVILRWIESLTGVPNRAGKWPDPKLTNISKLIQDEYEVWRYIEDYSRDDLKVGFEKLTITETGTDDLKSALWAEAVRTLVSACIRAHKRALEKTMSPGEETSERSSAPAVDPELDTKEETSAPLQEEQ